MKPETIIKWQSVIISGIAAMLICNSILLWNSTKENRSLIQQLETAQTLLAGERMKECPPCPPPRPDMTLTTLKQLGLEIHCRGADKPLVNPWSETVLVGCEDIESVSFSGQVIKKGKR